MKLGKLMVTVLIVLAAQCNVYAAESQKRIPGVISIDEKPATFRSGKVGAHVRYIAITCNLGRKAQTWPVEVGVEPPTPGLSVTAAKSITLAAGKCTRFPLTIVVSDGAPADREVWIPITVGPLSVHRHFRVCPCSRRPR